MELQYQTNNSTKFDFILNSLSLSIGRQTSLKCLHDSNGEIKFTKCYAKILNELIYSHKQDKDPFLNILNQFINSFHDKFKCSCKTALLSTIILWKLVNQKLLLSLSCIQQRRVFSYFNIILSESVKILLNSNQTCIKRLTSDVDHVELISGICRHSEMHSKLILNLLNMHKSRKLTFCFNKLNFLIDDNAIISYDNGANDDDKETYLIKFGLLIKPENKLNEQNSVFNMLMFDASLTHDFAHLGYNKDLKYKQIVKLNHLQSQLETSNSYYKWLNKVKSILKNFNINLVIVNGIVDKNLYEFATKNEILFVFVKNNEFEMLKSYFENCKILIYIEDFNDNYVYKCKYEKVNYKNYILIQNMSKNESNNYVISILFRNYFLKNHIKSFIEELKHYLKRFESILNEKIYLISENANFELELANVIMNINELKDNNPDGDDDDKINFNLAKEILYEFLINYKNLIDNNTLSLKNHVYDDLKSKIEAYKLAIYINNLYSNINLSVNNN